MSLGVIIKAPEGIVLAAESRVTMMFPQGQTTIPVTFDNATKLLSFGTKHKFFGAVTYGLASIGQRTAHSYLPELEAILPDGRISISDFANELSKFYLEQWKQSGLPVSAQMEPMCFVIAGFNENEPYGRIFEFNIPNAPVPNERFTLDQFNIVWGGMREFVDRLAIGYDPKLLEVLKQNFGFQQAQIQALQNALLPIQMPLPLYAMPLQDCVDLAIFFIRTTISAHNLTVGIRGCGGPIDVAIITRQKGIEFIQKKQIRGEKRIFSSVQEESA